MSEGIFGWHSGLGALVMPRADGQPGHWAMPLEQIRAAGWEGDEVSFRRLPRVGPPVIAGPGLGPTAALAAGRRRS